MPAYIVSSKYLHPEIGIIKIIVSAKARTIRARWDGLILTITIPPNLTKAQYNNFIDTYKEKLLRIKPSAIYSFTTHIETDHATFTIQRGYDGYYHTKREYQDGKFQINIFPPKHIDENTINNDLVQTTINNHILTAAKHVAEKFILQYAQVIALRIGIYPKAWQIKDYKHSLGRCNSKGIITLNPRLIFMPEKLREYIIIHELTHLIELNHSRAFHDLCNKYVKGREAELSTQVSIFKFPIY